jgi:transketolase
MPSMDKIDELCINTLRFLAVDAVEAAKSGHPGMPLGAAPIAYVLWRRFLRYDPDEPRWFNRDRFILSAGHGSALLYALIHLAGYDLPLDEVKHFRQWDSKTPGHPEYGVAPGVEVTTGPLGQGFAMGVGMAIAERYLAQFYNRPGFAVVDHHTYAVVSDGDLMEGVSHEAASLAGTLGLGKLIYLYDDNDISIEGHTDKTFTEDVGKRFEAYGWHVQHVGDANDIEAIDSALHKAQAATEKPSLLVIRSHIGYGSPKQDDASVHGEPLGPEAARATKQKLGWPLEPTFHVPEEARSNFRLAGDRGRELHTAWKDLLLTYRKQHPDLASSLEDAIQGRLPDGWDSTIPVFGSDDGPIATRAASGQVMNALAAGLSGLVGGSADLAPSTKTLLTEYRDFGRDDAGRNLRFGVREFVMVAAVNGMAIHGGLIPYGSTFLVFSDYARPALRLAAMMKARGIFIFTHDSIALGEDGPTHQPVEQLMSLRAIPGFTVMRPADANETAACWRLAVERRGPVALVLTRQKLPVLDAEAYRIRQGVPRGAYVLAGPGDEVPEIVLIATGSEVHLALKAARELTSSGIVVRTVSMPSWEVFEEQPDAYKGDVLPPEVPKLALEAGVTLGWERYTRGTGDVIGLDRFGASAPGATAYENLGFNVKNVVTKATALVRG